MNEPDPTDSPSLSVDRLTHAFAQLMGEEQTADPSPMPSDSDEDSTGQNDRPADDDDENVTPESIVEAILFIGHPDNEPLSSRMVASYLRGVSPGEVDDMVQQLNDGYEHQDAPYEIISDGPGYRLSLRAECENLRERFYGRIREARLSQVAIDLLAIVAYHQPISRKKIEAMRDRPCGSVLSQLVRRELLEVHRDVNNSKIILYRTTERFLDLFGLESPEDLPRPEDFQAG